MLKKYILFVLINGLVFNSYFNADGWTANATNAESDETSQTWALHAQTTAIWQYRPSMHSAFEGKHSLQADAETKQTFDLTLFAGVRPWQHAELWVNPEIDQGFGLSDTNGVAGFPNGGAYKSGSSKPYGVLQRFFLRQTFLLGGELEKVEGDQNQLAGSRTRDHVVVTVGKFSVVDVFDNNKYAHDVRTDFMNWTLSDLGSFDYAANSWGFTYGLSVDLNKDWWAVRTGVFTMSEEPNGTTPDTKFRQLQYDLEFEERHHLFNRDGKVKLLTFLTRANMGKYSDATARADSTNTNADIEAVRRMQNKFGFGVNVEQEVMDGVGAFLRAGWSKGDVESFDFTDVHRSVSLGSSFQGMLWGRREDGVGIGMVFNTISTEAQRFFNRGGKGLLIGDGRLPNPGTEQILEVYYNLLAWKYLGITFDYQFVKNPAYNTDRGPVSIFGLRIHASI